MTWYGRLSVSRFAFGLCVIFSLKKGGISTSMLLSEHILLIHYCDELIPLTGVDRRIKVELLSIDLVYIINTYERIRQCSKSRTVAEISYND